MFTAAFYADEDLRLINMIFSYLSYIISNTFSVFSFNNYFVPLSHVENFSFILIYVCIQFETQTTYLK